MEAGNTGFFSVTKDVKSFLGGKDQDRVQPICLTNPSVASRGAGSSEERTEQVALGAGVGAGAGASEQAYPINVPHPSMLARPASPLEGHARQVIAGAGFRLGTSAKASLLRGKYLARASASNVSQPSTGARLASLPEERTEQVATGAGAGVGAGASEQVALGGGEDLAHVQRSLTVPSILFTTGSFVQRVGKVIGRVGVYLGSPDDANQQSREEGEVSAVVDGVNLFLREVQEGVVVKPEDFTKLCAQQTLAIQKAFVRVKLADTTPLHLALCTILVLQGKYFTAQLGLKKVGVKDGEKLRSCIHRQANLDFRAAVMGLDRLIDLLENKSLIISELASLKGLVIDLINSGKNSSADLADQILESVLNLFFKKKDIMRVKEKSFEFQILSFLGNPIFAAKLPVAMLCRGHMYLKGLGVAQDCVQGRDLLETASDQGNKLRKYALDEIFSKTI